ncbi:MAG: hypothetical protein KDA81_11225, partial [Planctomycetaceae bacterium]|nr:hypothetical protein [Planctomycetaceae bacterium]
RRGRLHVCDEFCMLPPVDIRLQREGIVLDGELREGGTTRCVFWPQLSDKYGERRCVSIRF